MYWCFTWWYGASSIARLCNGAFICVMRVCLCNARLVGGQAVGRELLLHLIEHLVTQYGKDQKVTGLLNTATVHIMPTMNPDGFAVAEVNDCDGDQGR